MEIDYICKMKIKEVSNKEVIMVGAGGHALSVAEFASGNIEGYLSLSENPEMPGEWLGDDKDMDKYIELGRKFHIAFIYSGWPKMEGRRQLIELYESRGAGFATLISPTAIVTPKSRIGEGCAIMAGAIVNKATLGKNVVVNSGAIIEHDCKVGDNTFIGPGVVVGGFTTIGKNCFIGLGAKIINGAVIGDNITVAMGSIVNKNLTEPGIYHGNPLRCHKI